MNTEAWKELLQKLHVFETVRDEKQLDKLLAEGTSRERVVVKDEVIVRTGLIDTSVFVIDTGTVEVLLERSDGDPIVLAVLGPGDIFGEMGFCGRRKRLERSATARAKEPSTLLEISESGLDELVGEHPDVEFKLLYLASDRLRRANDQILKLQRTNIDEKLKLISARLDAEHMVFDAQLAAAGKVFEQTTARANEIITSAERSRDRLHKAAMLMGTFVTVAVGLLGLFGWSKVSDIERSRSEVNTIKTQTETYRNAAQTAADGMGKLKSEAEKSLRDATQSIQNANLSIQEAKKFLDTTVNDLRQGMVDIYRTRFIEGLEKGVAIDANQAYRQIRAVGGLAEELPTLLSEIERHVVARAQLPRTPQELGATRTFVALLQQAVIDAGAGRSREKLDAYYLLLVYAYLTDQMDFEQKDDEFKALATWRDTFAALQKYGDSNPATRQRPASRELAERLLREQGKRADDLQHLASLARISQRRP